jgi:hypothetical protein
MGRNIQPIEKKHIITNARGRQSHHNFGLAFDIVVLDSMSEPIGTQPVPSDLGAVWERSREQRSTSPLARIIHDGFVAKVWGPRCETGARNGEGPKRI